MIDKERRCHQEIDIKSGIVVKFVCTYSDGKVGVVQELAAYLAGKGESFWYLEHPLVHGNGATSRLDRYESGRLVETKALGKPAKGTVSLYLKATWITFKTVRARRRMIDLFIAASNVDCVVAHVALPRKRTKVIYVSIDFSPKRFSNPLLNIIFRLADRLAYRWASAVWHSYPNATTLKPYAPKEKCIETSHGNNFRRIQRQPFAQRKRSSLVYLGSVSPAAHLEAALIALKTLKPRFPDIRLHVIGEAANPAYMQSLKTIATSLDVTNCVTWHGLIAESRTFERIMTELGIALCLYEMTPEHYSWYQLPGKVFAYAACGLPTIVLDKCGPIGTHETEQNHIGVVTSLDGLAGCIAGLLDNPDMHKSLSESSEKWAAEYDWHTKFDKYLGMIDQSSKSLSKNPSDTGLA